MANRNVLRILFLLILTIIISSIIFAKYNKSPPVIFNFGDSNSDTGGFVAGNGTAFLYPNGRLFHRKSSGRDSDGRVVLDFLCEHVGSSHLSPYLEALGSDFTNGANFAIAGAATGIVFNPMSLSVQVDQFRHFQNRSFDLYAQGYKNVMHEKDFRNALYSIDIGQNDMWAALTSNLTITQVIERVPTYLSVIEDAIKTLYGTDARKFWIHNTGPMGCFPARLALTNPDRKELNSCGCLDYFNDVSRAFNNGLEALSNRLNLELSGSVIIYNNIYEIKYEIICNFTKYGFEHPFLACCGSGGPPYNFNLNTTCSEPGYEVCSIAEAKRHISWDGGHYTEAANRVVANKLLSSDYSTPRVKFEDLIRHDVSK